MSNVPSIAWMPLATERIPLLLLKLSGMPDIFRKCAKGTTIIDEVERANHLLGNRKEVAGQYRYGTIFALQEKWCTWSLIHGNKRRFVMRCKS